MRNRVAFVFVSSPNSVTPVHYDIEYSLLMQVRGTQDRQHRALRERRRPAARDRPVLGRLPRADRGPCRQEVASYHPDARAGGVHSPRHAALGAQRTGHLPVRDPHVLHRGLRCARIASRTSTRSFGAFTCIHENPGVPRLSTPPRSARWESGPWEHVFGPRVVRHQRRGPPGRC